MVFCSQRQWTPDRADIPDHEIDRDTAPARHRLAISAHASSASGG